MTDIEKKALALVNEVEREMGCAVSKFIDRDLPSEVALLRAIEQHEAFRQEVSDAVRIYSPENRNPALGRFIITEADEATAGLALAVEETLELVIGDEDARRLRAAIEARGGRIVWEGE